MSVSDSYFLSAESVQEQLHTNIEVGLSQKEVVCRRDKYGENSLPKEKKSTLWDLIVDQFNETLVRILLLAAIISAVLGMADHAVDMVDAIIEPCVILLVLILNAYITIKQTKNAEDAIEALKEYEPELAKVKRGDSSEVKWIKASELVPGDVVHVSVGDRIPADIRLCKILSTSLRVDQSILTGESVSVLKTIDEIPRSKSVVNQDKINILFSGCNIVSGKGVGVVVGTGSNTEIGHIWNQLTMTDNIRTPLQIKLDEFGNHLSKAITAICVLVWAININHFCDPIHGGSWIRGAVYYFKIAVALAVAAIPEGLPAVITTCLAIGTKKMAKKNAIVRSLPSVETLGCTSVICSDKTGTLTTNKMSIICAFVVTDAEENIFEHFSASGTTYNPADGSVTDSTGKKATAASHPVLEDLANVCVLCNDSSLCYNKDKQLVERLGEATEAALHTFAEKLDLTNTYHSSSNKETFVNIESIKERFEKLQTLEFSRDRKSMSSFCRDKKDGTCKMFVKGATEMVIKRCKYVRVGRDTVELTKELSDKILEQSVAYGTGPDTLRCLALAIIDSPKELSEYDLSDGKKFIEYETDMTFVGVVGMIDPPREQVKKAIEDCKSAGIRVIVITGDNKDTAVSICRKIGIFGKNEDITGLAFSASEFDSMSEDKQKECCKVARLFARVEPTHKSKIVNHLQFFDEITAMTGDGVNDAPALKKAEIGIAMGSGTAVAKSASDLVLADDDFSTIILAIKEGRSIYRNTVQFISYLVSSNIGEVISIFLTSMLGLPEGLIPVQLLWVNLITDGLPATALGFNPVEDDVMQRHPRKHKDPIIGGWQLARYTIIGAYVGIATVIANIWWYLYDPQGPHLTLKHLTNHQQCSATNPLYRNIDCELFNNYYPMTMALSVLVCSEMLNAYNSVSERQSILRVPPWRNKFLMIATVISMLIHIATTYFPLTQRIFQVTALSFVQWKVVFLLSVPILFLDEFLKFLSRNRRGD